MSLSNPSPRRMTRRGTRTLKAAYAQAARDVKRMDPAVLAAVGRSGMNGNDLKHLAHANVAALYGNGHERYAEQLNSLASAQVQATTPSLERTRNPFKKLSRWNENRKDVRQGKYVLQMAYAQAKSERKQIDPKVREAIGRSGVSKDDLKMLSHSQLSGVVRNGIEQAAQQHYANARAAAAAVAARPDPVRQTAGQRAANVVNTVSRWSKAVADGSRAVKNGAMAKAEKFAADYNERRQNPTGRSARPATPEAAAPGREEAAPAVERPVAGPETAPVAAPTAEAGPATAPAAVDVNGPPTLVRVEPVVPENAAAFTDGPPTIELPVITDEPAPGAAQEGQNLADTRAREAKEFHAGLNNTLPAVEAPESGGRHRAPEEPQLGGNAPVFNGPVNGAQIATNNGSVTQYQNGAVTSQQTDQSGKPAGPPPPGSDPAMAPAAGAVGTKPAAAQATNGQTNETAKISHSHRKPDGVER